MSRLGTWWTMTSSRYAYVSPLPHMYAHVYGYMVDYDLVEVRIPQLVDQHVLSFKGLTMISSRYVCPLSCVDGLELVG